MNRIFEAFGPHLLVDGWGCDPVSLGDMDLVYRFLDCLPGRIGMTPIMPPLVYRYKGGGEGLSGIILIAESHIAIHTWPEYGTLNLDIFSCKEFDTGLAIGETLRFFPLAGIRKKVFDRGLEFPRNTKIVRDHLTAERGTMRGA